MVRNESEKMSPKSETNVSDFRIQCILICYLEVTLGNSVLDKHHNDRVITTHSGPMEPQNKAIRSSGAFVIEFYNLICVWNDGGYDTMS